MPETPALPLSRVATGEWLQLLADFCLGRCWYLLVAIGVMVSCCVIYFDRLILGLQRCNLAFLVVKTKVHKYIFFLEKYSYAIFLLNTLQSMCKCSRFYVCVHIALHSVIDYLEAVAHSILTNNRVLHSDPALEHFHMRETANFLSNKLSLTDKGCSGTAIRSVPDSGTFSIVRKSFVHLSIVTYKTVCSKTVYSCGLWNSRRHLLFILKSWICLWELRLFSSWEFWVGVGFRGKWYSEGGALLFSRVCGDFGQSRVSHPTESLLRWTNLWF